MKTKILIGILFAGFAIVAFTQNTTITPIISYSSITNILGFLPQPASATLTNLSGTNFTADASGNVSVAGTVTADSVTATNNAAVGNLLQSAELYTGSFKLYRGTLTHAGTVTLPFGSTNRYWGLSPTGAITLATSGLAAGLHANIIIDGTGVATNMTFTFPGWRFVGYKPTYLTAGKIADIYLKATGANDTNVIAYYGEEQ